MENKPILLDGKLYRKRLKLIKIKVAPMTIAMLIKQTVESTEIKSKL